MKVAILAGGYGTRLSEETYAIPKPMVRIGDFPMIWHIMKIYSHYGFNEFVILMGYKGYMIKEYFSNYAIYRNNICIDFSQDKVEVINKHTEPWKVTLLDTGLNSMTGARVAKAREHLEDDAFMLTYGDGV